MTGNQEALQPNWDPFQPTGHVDLAGRGQLPQSVVWQCHPLGGREFFRKEPSLLFDFPLSRRRGTPQSDTQQQGLWNLQLRQPLEMLVLPFFLRSKM